jgi:hypothetical protein
MIGEALRELRTAYEEHRWADVMKASRGLQPKEAHLIDVCKIGYAQRMLQEEREDDPRRVIQ